MKTRIFSTATVVVLAAMMLCGSTSAKGKEFKLASSLENAIDPLIKIENWMVNDFVWSKAAKIELYTDSDRKLCLEGWMINPANWEMEYSVTEEVLHIENWMIDDKYWSVKSCNMDNEKDKDLKLEAWMVQDTNWK